MTQWKRNTLSSQEKCTSFFFSFFFLSLSLSINSSPHHSRRRIKLEHVLDANSACCYHDNLRTLHGRLQFHHHHVVCLNNGSRSLFQREFSTECDLVLPLSSVVSGHQAPVYALSRLPVPFSNVLQNGKSYTRFHQSFLRFIIRRTLNSLETPCNTSFFTK